MLQWKVKKTMKKKNTKWKIAIIAFGLLAAGITIFLFRNMSPLNDERLKPAMGVEVLSEDRGDQGEVFSLTEKAIISKGKYGFRKTLIFKEPVTITQELVADVNLYDSPIYYGIYRDKGLRDAIVEVDLKASLHADAAIEEGGDVEDYPEYIPVLRTNLEPGKYYVGIYTTKLFNMDRFKFYSSAGELLDQVELYAGEDAYWNYAENAEGEVNFKFVSDRTGKGEMIFETLPQDSVLTICNASKEPVVRLVKRIKPGGFKASFNFEKGKAYFIKLHYPAIKRPDYSVVYPCKVTLKWN